MLAADAALDAATLAACCVVAAADAAAALACAALVAAADAATLTALRLLLAAAREQLQKKSSWLSEPVVFVRSVHVGTMSCSFVS